MLRLIERLQRFFASWRFPAFVVSLLVAFDAVMLLVLLVPAPAAIEAFADEFRVWCFGYDPQKKTVEIAYVIMTFGEPLGLATLITLVWRKSLVEALRSKPRALAAHALSALVVVVAAQVGFYALNRTSGDKLPLPTALRTSVTAPHLALTDQNGEAFDLEAQRGRVVVVTGVYASCGLTCPMIMGQAKRAIAALAPAERADVVVAAVTLDPEHDDRGRLDAMARAQSVSSPPFHLLWGAPEEVNTTLDDFGITRTRDPATGRIDHANLFVLVDRRGKIAYRLTLGEQQREWLVQALHTLVAEQGAT